MPFLTLIVRNIYTRKVRSSLTGAAVAIDKNHPFCLELGIQPDKLEEFGVQVVAGAPYGPTAPDEIMLGFRAARDFDKSVGDTFTVEDQQFRVVGIFPPG